MVLKVRTSTPFGIGVITVVVIGAVLALYFTRVSVDSETGTKKAEKDLETLHEGSCHSIQVVKTPTKRPGSMCPRPNSLLR